MKSVKVKITIKIKRVYDTPSEEDGYRVLIDRLWPRGLSKSVAVIQSWVKDIAPSTELRKWFDHDPLKWAAFQEKYMDELKHNPSIDSFWETISHQKTVTLLYSAKDEKHNNAIVLKSFLTSKL